ncbi:TATA box-binding protein-associated factor RNA polymerase I subunit C [Antennarius striatus]|uniref:TATA box-binding protein-associated factor RNA polymerase I subunit C n=1 Tax=Antennarius striatus TaxID=241820 RepID=UPI0035AE4F7E
MWLMTDKMDYQFPSQLFPSFYNSGPPDSVQCATNWGSYNQVKVQDGSGPHSRWTFTSSHQAKGETWHLQEPLPLPLLSPQNSVLWSQKPPDPMDFTEHMQNFFLDHSLDAFGCMAEIVGENFYFKQGSKSKTRKDSVNMWKVKSSLDMLNFKICHRTYSSQQLDTYGALMSDVVHAVPTVLLGALLHEELTEQRDRLLFAEGATGGALAFVPFAGSSRRSELGCLLYPGNKALDCLNFHRVELQQHNVDTSSSDPFSFQLKGPIRQISTSSLLDDYSVAVRSDYFCGVWHFGESSEPRLLQVAATKEVATCVNISPHVLGEVLVVSESGAANLWTVGRGMQKVRQEDCNLYFNALSSWRWCEFSAHPRVVLYADRTGVELTDIRVRPAVGHTLFHISRIPECRRGERLILTRYLGDVHSFHHLITTQYSVYIMDERFPHVPMVKWDHMMQSPPMFCHVPASSSCGSTVGGARTTKVLLGSQRSQEITLLQYSGGRVEACSSRGPPQSLLRPKDSLKHLPLPIPHHLDAVTDRLSSPATGLTCIQTTCGRETVGEECICVLQLTEAGDIFYQLLQYNHEDGCEAPAAAEQFLSDPQLVASDTSSDDDLIGPTHSQGFVGETLQRELREMETHSASSSEDSESAKKGWTLNQSRPQVVVNNPDEAVTADGPGGIREKVRGSSNLSNTTTLKISDSALIIWKHWLENLIENICTKPPRPQRLQHLTTETKRLDNLSGDERHPTDEEHVQSLRHHLRACMSTRSLLLHPPALRPLEVLPVPNQVDTDQWTDPLNQRLTVSWQGDEAWQTWWEDELGMNREKKLDALRRKRRREKKARRARGKDRGLLGSFTSTVSYQSELDDFSDVTALSPAPSHMAWSDSESMASNVEKPRAATPSFLKTDHPVCSQPCTPQRFEDGQRTPSKPPTFSVSQSPKPSSVTGSQRKNKRPLQNYLSSLLEPEEDTFQLNSYFPEEGEPVRTSQQPVASSSQLRSSQSLPSRSLFALSSFSQSSQSQSSQGRLGLSQASQPKKKMSRMGF